MQRLGQQMPKVGLVQDTIFMRGRACVSPHSAPDAVSSRHLGEIGGEELVNVYPSSGLDITGPYHLCEFIDSVFHRDVGIPPTTRKFVDNSGYLIQNSSSWLFFAALSFHRLSIGEYPCSVWPLRKRLRLLKGLPFAIIHDYIALNIRLPGFPNAYPTRCFSVGVRWCICFLNGHGRT